MRYNVFIATLIILFGINYVNAQEPANAKLKDTSTLCQLAKYDATNAFKGVVYAFKRPAYWKKKDFTTLGLIVAGTLSIAIIDEEANGFFAKQEPNVPEIIKDFGWYVGNPQNYFAVTTGIYGFGLLTKNEKVRKTGVLIIASSFATGILQSITKTVVGRARPTENIGSASFEPFSKAPGFHSFPSGHTVLSITMAHSIAKLFDNTWTKIGIYTLGSIAPISRLLAGAHWLSDIAFSTALSIIVVDSIDKFLFNTKAYSYPKKEKTISWNFKFSSNQIGVVGTF